MTKEKTVGEAKTIDEKIGEVWVTIPGAGRFKGYVIGTPAHDAFLAREADRRHERIGQRGEAFIRGGVIKRRKGVIG